jgi:cold shock CspA family protein/ribosome-associated translation inhibitor RaiA
MGMQKPLEITYHNMQPSDWIEAEIRERVGKLEKISDRLTGVRVSLELLHRQHRTGNIYEVHIDMTVPRDELVVSRTPHRPKERYANADLRTSIREAFEAAERQLIEYKEQLRGDVKVHEPMFQGQVSQIDPGGEFGFILTNEGTQLYFHRNSLLEGEFEKLRRGDPVHYVASDGDTGPTAKKVWTGSEERMD